MPIVTDGLIGYWNSKQGVVGAVWENIAPTTVGTLNGAITGALLQADGMYFDGVDDGVMFNTSLGIIGEHSIEAWVIPSSTATVNGIIVSGSSLIGLLQYNSSSSIFRYYKGSFNSTVQSYPTNNMYHVVMTLSALSSSQITIKFYINGVLDVSINVDAIISTTNWDYASWSIGRRPNSSISSYFFKGHIPVVRFYNRMLSPAEITQNYAVSTEVGLSEAPPPTTPVVTQLNASKTKISDEVGVNQAIITVQFDTDVTQYVARLNGVDHTTGTLVHTGGAVAANTDAQIVIDWNELTTEGSNRINVYGQNANGWTTLT